MRRRSVGCLPGRKIIHFTKVAGLRDDCAQPLLRRKQRRRKASCLVTVCIASMFERTGILGASDRMLTAGDIQFEPTVTKIRMATKSVFIMLAGDSEVQDEVCQELSEDLAKMQLDMGNAPEGSIRVSKVAELYAKRRNEAHNRRAQQAVLAPFGMDLKEFHRLQSTLSVSFVEKVCTELFNFEGPTTESIIAGLDVSGPHIFVCRNAEVSCRDAAGFAAIGAGAWHAESHLMFADQTPANYLADSLLNIHFAKRRSEVAPGVGKHTDMVFINSLGEIIWVGDHIHSKLDEVYKAHIERLEENNKAARYEMGRYVEELVNPNPDQPQEQLQLPEVGYTGKALDQEIVRPDVVGPV
jgi:hypothetical protein